MQCTFCCFPNILGEDEQGALCKNCGLDLSRLTTTEHRAETAEPDAGSEPVAPLNDAGTDIDPISQLFGDAAAGTCRGD